MHPGEAIRGFLAALGVPAERIPADLDAQAGLYRSLLAGRRMLIVLDNARDAAQVRPLLPGQRGLPGRGDQPEPADRPGRRRGARPLSLDVLTEEEARELLARRLGASGSRRSPTRSMSSIELCARLPLALAIVAARAAAHPACPLAALAAELRDARWPAGRLDAGDAGHEHPGGVLLVLPEP